MFHSKALAAEDILSCHFPGHNPPLPPVKIQSSRGAMFVKDDKTRHKAPNEHIFNKGAIKRAELLDAWRRFMDKPGDQGGFDPARRLSDEDLVVRKAAPGSRGGTR